MALHVSLRQDSNRFLEDRQLTPTGSSAIYTVSFLLQNEAPMLKVNGTPARFA